MGGGGGCCSRVSVDIQGGGTGSMGTISTTIVYNCPRGGPIAVARVSVGIQGGGTGSMGTISTTIVDNCPRGARRGFGTLIQVERWGGGDRVLYSDHGGRYKPRNEELCISVCIFISEHVSVGHCAKGEESSCEVLLTAYLYNFI